MKLRKPLSVDQWPWMPTPVECAYAELVVDAPAGFLLLVVPDQSLANPRDKAAVWIAGRLGQA